jgi:Caspase domain
MWVRVFVATLLLQLPAAAFAQEKRIALLIGNRTYDASVGILKNPHNDIAIVGEALTRQGFEVLPPIKDARRSAILGGVRDLVRRLNTSGDGAIGFLYYSGHGAADKDTNTNYLIPVDAKEPGAASFWDESLKLDDVLRLLDGARSAAKFVVFDACRSELQMPTKDANKGLVPVAEQQGIFIAYSTSPGRTASDRGDKSGPYAAALAAELLRPGLDHLNLFQNVKETVLASTAGVQQPWESNGLGRRVYLTEQAKLDQGLAPRLVEAAEAWNLTKDAKEIGVLEAFARRYNETLYAEMARSRIEALQKQTARQQTTLPPDPQTSAFDGNWMVAVNCPKYLKHAGYSQSFRMLIRDGILHGEFGEKGKPAWRSLDGEIAPSGSASIHENGLNWPGGQAYGFFLSGQFDGTRGTAKRVPGPNVRDCRFIFTKL